MHAVPHRRRSSASVAAAGLAAVWLLVGCDPPLAPECTGDPQCPGGSCVDGACVPNDDVCAPLATCGGTCTDLSNDRDSCGGCGHRCDEGVGCQDGACCPVESPTVCGGACTDTSTDAAHCGACGEPCASGESCSAGSCCPGGTVRCGEECVDVTADPFHCGGCELACPVGAACEGGSCAACPGGTLEVDCGPLRVCQPEERMELPCMVEIPAGPFTLGTDERPGSGPAHEVTLSPFLLDLFEVTQAAFAECVAASGCPEPDAFHPTVTPQLPVNWLDWEAANRYCRWRGGRLPTEAEWEKAARGTDGRSHAWGNEAPDCTRAAASGCVEGLRPAGERPAGRSAYGLFDMAGNVAEWVNDWFGGDYPAGPATDPQGPATGSERIRRGYGYRKHLEQMLVWSREPLEDPFVDQEGGVRCARDL